MHNDRMFTTLPIKMTSNEKFLPTNLFFVLFFYVYVYCTAYIDLEKNIFFGETTFQTIFKTNQDQ